MERKLEVLAEQIGKFGLAAAFLSLTASAGQFTWDTFFVQGRPWEWTYLNDYLTAFINAITIVASPHLSSSAARAIGDVSCLEAVFG